jgi:hypothetical protein
MSTQAFIRSRAEVGITVLSVRLHFGFPSPPLSEIPQGDRAI